jgi:signal-transduction protein with cAMP-binding, CBS, and nucleotidyltransferase domain
MMDDRQGSAPGEPWRMRTVGELMRPAVTTVERHSHLAAAAYQMKHAGDTAVVVTTDDESRRPIGIITDSDISHAVADGADLNEARIDHFVGSEPVNIRPGASADEAASVMLSAHIRHLPVVEDGRLLGIVDINDACRELLNAAEHNQGPAAG